MKKELTHQREHIDSSFVYPIYCLRLFLPPCSQPCRNVVFYRQRFKLVGVGLVREVREERSGECVRVLIVCLESRGFVVIHAVVGDVG